MPGFNTAPIHNSGNVPLPNNPVYVYIWDIPQLVGINARNEPFVYLKDCTLPEYDVGVESVKTGHAQYEFASQIKWTDVKLTFYDTGSLANKLNELSKRAWSKDSGIRPADEYMFQSVINVYYYDNTLAYTWKLTNSWIRSVKWAKMTYESSGMGQATVVLKYTYAELEPVGGGGGTILA